MDEALGEGNDEDRNERARRLATLRKRRQREKTTGEKRLMTDLPSVGRSMDEALDEGNDEDRNDEDRNERARRLATLRKRRQREKTGEKRLMTEQQRCDIRKIL